MVAVFMVTNVPHPVRDVNRKRYVFYKSTEIRYNVDMSKYESLFTQRVVETIENMRRERRMTIDDLCKASGIGRNSYYAKLRCERCFNTEEIDAIARVLECDPYLLLEEAAMPKPDIETITDRLIKVAHGKHIPSVDLAAYHVDSRDLEADTPEE